MDIIRDREKGTLILSQGKYIEKILKTLGMTDAKAVITPTTSHFNLRSLIDDELKEEAAHRKGFHMLVPWEA